VWVRIVYSNNDNDNIPKERKAFGRERLCRYRLVSEKAFEKSPIRRGPSPREEKPRREHLSRR
jgi:hypothetical protein